MTNITNALKELQSSIDRQTIILKKILEQTAITAKATLSPLRLKDEQRAVNSVQEYLKDLK